MKINTDSLLDVLRANKVSYGYSKVIFANGDAKFVIDALSGDLRVVSCETTLEQAILKLLDLITEQNH